jgi:ABC-2 type transport system ATP-binding protein
MGILSVENVSKQYVGHKALDDVSLTVPQGSVYGLLGPNGAGKTTLIRIINHITAPDSGRVIINDHQLTQADVNNIGYLPEERGLYTKMKVGEQALFFARLKGLSRSDATRQLKQWFEKFGISDWWGRKVQELSKGMAQKVQFIVTVLHNPQLLIFDEPFSGFDPINARLLKDEILELRDKGATIIFSTHNMSSVEAMCDHITLINNSHNILTGRVDDIRREHGKNRYTISFNGDANLLKETVGQRVRAIEAESVDDSGATTMTLRLADDVTARQLIGSINDVVELLSFNAFLPSMDDIFIRSVQQSNSNE